MRQILQERSKRKNIQNGHTANGSHSCVNDVERAHGAKTAARSTDSAAASDLSHLVNKLKGRGLAVAGTSKNGGGRGVSLTGGRVPDNAAGAGGAEVKQGRRGKKKRRKG